MKTLRILALALSLVCHGCITKNGYGLVTGTARPAIPPQAVKIFLEKPTGSEDIGIVRAYSVGISGNGQTQTLTTNLIIEASKMGANGVLIKNFSIIPGRTGTAEGIAFVAPPKKD